MREGIILRLENTASGKIAFGEVAPLEPFGTESTEAAIRILFSLPRHLHSGELQSAMEAAPPATAFGIASALNQLQNTTPCAAAVSTAALLSLDGDTPEAIRKSRRSGSHTYKLKLGIATPAEEQTALESVIRSLEPEERLRLDPNQSWDRDVWLAWNPFLEENLNSIEFLEEPFQAGLMTAGELTDLAQHSPVPLALDESLSSSGIREWQSLDWPGYYVLKPSLMGNPRDWLAYLDGDDKVILSSAFETGIGLSSLLDLAGTFPKSVHGLGTQSFFMDALGTPEENSALTPLSIEAQETLWKHLPND